MKRKGRDGQSRWTPIEASGGVFGSSRGRPRRSSLSFVRPEAEARKQKGSPKAKEKTPTQRWKRRATQKRVFHQPPKPQCFFGKTARLKVRLAWSSSGGVRHTSLAAVRFDD